MTTCASGLAEPLFLTEEECYAVLATSSAGRLDFARHGLPVPIPVRYALHNRALVLLPQPGNALGRALDGAAVSLEVDVRDLSREVGWRVVVVGSASISEEAGHVVVRLTPTDVTGHRLPSPRPQS